MKNDLDRSLEKTRLSKRKALIAYLAAGDPPFPQQTKIIRAMAAAGVTAIELGVPFSDPIADGPTIQAASQRALNNGITLAKIIRQVPQIKKESGLPIILMGYLNPLYAYGAEKFARDAGRSGVSAVIIPDLIPEEGRSWETVLEKHGVHLIYLLAPTTPLARQRMIARRTRGFLYAVSVAGVTGARLRFSNGTRQWLSHLRGIGPRPVCVGFGISGPQQIHDLKKSVDGFIVGSALVDLVHKAPAGKKAQKAAAFIRSLAKECAYGR